MEEEGGGGREEVMWGKDNNKRGCKLRVEEKPFNAEAHDVSMMTDLSTDYH